MPDLGKATYTLEIDASQFDRELAEAKAEALAASKSINDSLSGLRIGAGAHVTAIKNITAAHSELGRVAGDKNGPLAAQLLGLDQVKDRWNAINGITTLFEKRMDILSSKIQRSHELGLSTGLAEQQLTRMSTMLDRFYRDATNRWLQFDRDLSRRVGLQGGGTRDGLLGRLLGVAYGTPKGTGPAGMASSESAMMATLATMVESGGRGGGAGGPPIPSGWRSRGNGGNSDNGSLSRMVWGRGHWGMAGAGTLAGVAGFDAAHAGAVGLGLAGSAVGALGGGAILGAGILGRMGVGAGSDAAVMKSSIADTQTLYKDYTNLQNAVGQYGANSVAAHQATLQLNADMQMLGNTAGVQAEMGVAKLTSAVNTYWDKATSTARVQSANIMTQVLDLARTYIPLVNQAATTNLGIINKGLKPLFSWLEGPQGTGIFKDLESQFAKTLPTAVHAFDQAVELLVKTIDYASHQSGNFIYKIDHFFTKYNSPTGFAGWEGHMNNLIADFRAWWTLIKLVGQDIYGIFSNDQKTGVAVINTINGALEKLHTWEQLTRGKTALKTIFEVHKQEVLALLHAIGSLQPVLSSIFGIYMQVMPPIVNAVTTALKTLSPVISTVGKGIGDLAGAGGLASLFTAGGLMYMAGKHGGGGAGLLSKVLLGPLNLLNPFKGGGSGMGDMTGADGSTRKMGSVENPLAVVTVDGSNIPGAKKGGIVNDVKNLATKVLPAGALDLLEAGGAASLGVAGAGAAALAGGSYIASKYPGTNPAYKPGNIYGNSGGPPGVAGTPLGWLVSQLGGYAPSPHGRGPNIHGSMFDPSMVQQTKADTKTIDDSLKQVQGAFYETSSSAGKSMTAINTAVGHATTYIKNVLPAGSKDANQALANNFYIGAAAVAKSMKDGAVSVSVGIAAIAKMLGAALTSLGVSSPLAKELSTQAAQGSRGAAINIGAIVASGGTNFGSGSGNVAGGLAVGGYVGSPGQRGPDSVPAMLGMGEAVLNGPQQMLVNSALSSRYGWTLPDLFSATRGTRHFASGGYVDPIPGFSLGRTDMGVDANAAPGTPIGAIGPSKLVYVNPNWYQGQPLLDFQLMGGPDAGKFWYVAEQIAPVTEALGSMFKAGQMVARYANSGTGIEIGWAGNAFGATLAQSLGNTGGAGHSNSPSGSSFRNFLSGLAQGKIFGGVPSSITAPKIGGHGMFGALGQAAVDQVANAANSYLSGLGGAGAYGGTVPAGAWRSTASSIAKRHGWGPREVAAWYGVEQMEDASLSLSAKNPTSPAYGLAQFINGPKDYYRYGGNPNTLVGQLTAMANYMAQRYTTPSAAYAFHQTHPYYTGGGFANHRVKGGDVRVPQPKSYKLNHHTAQNLTSAFSLIPDAADYYTNITNGFGPWINGLQSLDSNASTLSGITNADGSTNTILTAAVASMLNGEMPPGLLNLPGGITTGNTWPMAGQGQNIFDFMTSIDASEISVLGSQQSTEAAALNLILGTGGSRSFAGLGSARKGGALYARYSRLSNILKILGSDLARAKSIATMRLRIQNRINAIQGKGLKNALSVQGTQTALRSQISDTQAALLSSNASTTTLSNALSQEQALGQGADYGYMQTLRARLQAEAGTRLQLDQILNSQNRALSMSGSKSSIQQAKLNLLSFALRTEDTALGNTSNTLSSQLANLGGLGPTSATAVGANGGVAGQINTQISALNQGVASLLGDLQSLPSQIVGLHIDMTSLASQKTQAGLGNQQTIIDLQNQLLQQQGAEIYTQAMQSPILAGFAGAASSFLGAFESGTPFVPQTGMALVHAGEAIIPAESNPFTKPGASAAPPQLHIHGLGDFVDRVEMVVDGKKQEIKNYTVHDMARNSRAKRLLPGAQGPNGRRMN